MSVTPRGPGSAREGPVPPGRPRRSSGAHGIRSRHRSEHQPRDDHADPGQKRTRTEGLARSSLAALAMVAGRSSGLGGHLVLDAASFRTGTLRERGVGDERPGHIVLEREPLGGHGTADSSVTTNSEVKERGRAGRFAGRIAPPVPAGDAATRQGGASLIRCASKSRLSRTRMTPWSAERSTSRRTAWLSRGERKKSMYDDRHRPA